MILRRTEIEAVYLVPALREIASRSRRAPTRGIQGYGVIRGRPSEPRVVEPSGDAPHYHILLETRDGQKFDASVDIYDKLNGGAEVLFLLVAPFTPPGTDAEAWLALPSGATTIGPAGSGGLGLDYLRQDLVTRDRMSLLPVDPSTIGTTLTGPVADLVNRAIADPTAEVFAFGKMFAGGGRASNPVFGFTPDAGIHDMHLNQGEPGDQGNTYEDGALIVHFASDNHWEAAFFAFQDQSFAVEASSN